MKFKERLVSELAKHQGGTGELHFRMPILEQQYDVRWPYAAQLLVRWAEEGLISMQAYDGTQLRPWNQWPSLEEFFYNRTDGGHVRIALLADGVEVAETLSRGIGFVQSV